MNIDEVPQEPLHFKDREKLKKLMYAVDKQGNYAGVNSAGWEAENLATRQAWDAVADELKETEQQIKAGKLSPIAYYMCKNLMDVPLLAKYVGKWTWQVKQHLQPSGFNKISPATLARYAGIFNISIDELKNFGKG
jgi:hypothetical protein